MSKWCGDENCLQCADKEPDPYVHLPREDYQALRDERDRLAKALQAFCDEVEMDAAAMAYKCGLGAGEWESFIDRTKLYKQYLAGKAALTPAGEGRNDDRAQS